MGQRELYAKGGITKWYWDFRDRAVLRHTVGVKSVLDIGCGEGITLEGVAKQSWNRLVVGIDPDESNVKICEQFWPAVKKGDAYHLPLVAWDCCLLLDVIEHLADPGRTLREVHRVLASKGTLVIMFPNDRLFFLARLAFLKFRAAFADYGHLWKFKPGVMTDILQGMGFSVESVESLPWKWFPLHYLIVARKI